jgi:hypothetical protein
MAIFMKAMKVVKGLVKKKGKGKGKGKASRLGKLAMQLKARKATKGKTVNFPISNEFKINATESPEL